MPRIKITGYINTEDMDQEFVDLTSDTGVTEEGLDAVGVTEVGDLIDWEIELITDKPSIDETFIHGANDGLRSGYRNIGPTRGGC